MGLFTHSWGRIDRHCRPLSHGPGLINLILQGKFLRRHASRAAILSGLVSSQDQLTWREEKGRRIQLLLAILPQPGVGATCGGGALKVSSPSQVCLTSVHGPQVIWGQGHLPEHQLPQTGMSFTTLLSLERTLRIHEKYFFKCFLFFNYS